MTETENTSARDKTGFGLRIWFGISIVLSILGLISLAEGLGVWTKFLRDIIDIYRATVREPLAYIGNAIWPFGHIPHWVFDIVVIWSAFFLALNLFMYGRRRTTLFGHTVNHWRSGRPGNSQRRVTTATRR